MQQFGRNPLLLYSEELPSYPLPLGFEIQKVRQRRSRPDFDRKAGPLACRIHSPNDIFRRLLEAMPM
jgi:hypothetical protein